MPAIKLFLSYSSKDKLFADQPYVRMSPSGLTGSTFQSEERDQLLIHDLPVMIGVLRTNFISVDLNEARSRKRDPVTGSPPVKGWSTLGLLYVPPSTNAPTIASAS